MAFPRHLILRPCLLISALMALLLIALPQLATAQDDVDTDFEEVVTDSPTSEIRPYIGVAVEALDVQAFDGGGIDFFPETTTTAVIRGLSLIHI